MTLSPCHSKSIGTDLLRVGLLLLLAVAGCRTPEAPAPNGDLSLIWPPPPALPQIAYVKSIEGPDSFGIRRNWWRKAGDFLVGNDRSRTTLVKPTALCFDENGNLCVTDTGNATVWFFDAARKRYKRWDRIGKLAFSSPVAVVKQNGVFYVADSGLGAIIAFNEKGKLLFTISDGLERPSGLAIHGETLWVADAARHSIDAFDLQGRHQGQFGRRGTKAGEFNYPTHLSLSHETTPTLYVTDSMNFRIQKVDALGSSLQSVGEIGNVSGTFTRPKGTAVDRDGNFYVVDALFDNIQIFDNQGRFLMHWGENGTNPGQFWLPSGIAVDADNQIWVADSYNRRIQVFKRVGER